MIKINVTQKHINKGKRMKICECPIAHAVSEHFQIDSKDKLVEVGIEDATIYNDKDKEIYKLYTLPRSASRFVVKFDDKGRNAVKPFNFFLKEA